ncbi:MAG TPA: hypothetical protein VIV58_31200 [Kofleriaceae bacterium]
MALMGCGDNIEPAPAPDAQMACRASSEAAALAACSATYGERAQAFDCNAGVNVGDELARLGHRNCYQTGALSCCLD